MALEWTSAPLAGVTPSRAVPLVNGERIFDGNVALVKGAGELASGVSYRLHHAGFKVVMTELEQPLCVCRAASFAEAVPNGRKELEGVEAAYVGGVEEALQVINQGHVAILVDEPGGAANSIRPTVLVDAIMAKRNTGTRKSDAPIVLALGPGFRAGEDAHAVIETKRGHRLGRVLLTGSAEPNTGVPELIDGHTVNRLLLSPAAGTLACRSHIGDRVRAGEVVAVVGGTPVVAGISGIVRGLLPEGYAVDAGAKVGDLDPSAEPEFCYSLSDRALSIGSAALAAIIELWPRAIGDNGGPARRRGRRSPALPAGELLSVPEFALLGLLAQRPAHGYDLSRLLAPGTELGSVFRLGLSQLYASLTKLETHGLITDAAPEAVTSARGKRVYQLTDSGRRQFEDWLRRPVPGSRYIRPDFLVKLYFARRTGARVATALVDQQRDVLRDELLVS
ncbi:MAG: EF2563 family selenium-dependent molybdenum hydroxylase system protein, partial [Chloroflexi bacterium]|nr:EF2563 family selenium-dependent molybdenum hydroxylase system protein [Chloroflexota bacterium]